MDRGFAGTLSLLGIESNACGLLIPASELYPQPLSFLSLVLSSVGEHSWFCVVKLEYLKTCADCNYPDTIQQNGAFESGDLQMSKIGGS